jgi:hypothetical protein
MEVGVRIYSRIVFGLMGLLILAATVVAGWKAIAFLLTFLIILPAVHYVIDPRSK